MASELDEILDRAQTWRTAGHGVAMATVVHTWGSSPRPVGSHLVINDRNEFAGSVSGGCIEGAVIQEAGATIADGKPRLLEFGVSDEQAWEVGLSCGGCVQVFIERLHADHGWVIAQWRARRPVALVTRLADGAHARVDPSASAGELPLAEESATQVRERLRGGNSGLLDQPGKLFARVYSPPPRLLIVGAGHIAQALAPMAAIAGFDVTVIDPRRAFASAGRFPGVDLCAEWPDEAIRRLAPDERTAIVTLSHDPKLDDPALAQALAGTAFYIGSLGSSRTHAKRIARLSELGFGTRIERIHAPVGLDLGGRQPSEIAVSILAEIIRERYRIRRDDSR